LLLGALLFSHSVHMLLPFMTSIPSSSNAIIFPSYFWIRSIRTSPVLILRNCHNPPQSVISLPCLDLSTPCSSVILVCWPHYESWAACTSPPNSSRSSFLIFDLLH
jgi:hypothetical protein